MGALMTNKTAIPEQGYSSGRLFLTFRSVCSDGGWSLRPCVFFGRMRLKSEIEDGAREDEQERYDLGLCRMQEDVILGIDPDLFYKKPFDTIDEQIDSKKGPGHFQLFA